MKQNMFLPLSHEYIRRAHSGELRDIVVGSGYSTTIAGKEFAIATLARRMRKSELQECLMNIPHVRNTGNPSWFDLFCEVQENSGSITDKVSKTVLRRLVDVYTSLDNTPLVQIYRLPPSAFNLRTLAAKLGYVKISTKMREMSLEKCCEMLGFEIPNWGYQSDVILWAKYQGFRSAESYKSEKSCRYLGITSYPKTIRELSLMDVDRYNDDVEEIRASLRDVIRNMRPRTKLVKYRLIALFKEDFEITTSHDHLSLLSQDLNLDVFSHFSNTPYDHD